MIGTMDLGGVIGALVTVAVVGGVVVVAARRFFARGR